MALLLGKFRFTPTIDALMCAAALCLHNFPSSLSVVIHRVGFSELFSTFGYIQR
jgi:hypothetical protein